MLLPLPAQRPVNTRSLLQTHQCWPWILSRVAPRPVQVEPARPRKPELGRLFPLRPDSCSAAVSPALTTPRGASNAENCPSLCWEGPKRWALPCQEDWEDSSRALRAGTPPLQRSPRASCLAQHVLRGALGRSLLFIASGPCQSTEPHASTRWFSF